LDRGTEFRNMVDEARHEYLRLSDAYDLELTKAYQHDHGSPETIEALKKANRITTEVSAALQRYHDAAEALAAFYSSQNSS
jgi:hypothetical protein